MTRFFPKEGNSFYRIVQECLTNVVKHSEATEAHICIRCDEGKLSLEVCDNGKGFTPPQDRVQP